MSRPDDLLYAKSHEWIRVAESTVTLGITDFAVEQLGDLAFIDLPEEGDSVEEGSVCGEIESTKTVADLVSPVSGQVVEVNSAAVEDLEIVSHSPFEDGWLLRIEASEIPENLLKLEDYESFLETEAH